MFHKTRTIAPEPYFSGALWLMYNSFLYMRAFSDEISAEELIDLNDALHNVPASIQEYGL